MNRKYSVFSVALILLSFIFTAGCGNFESDEIITDNTADINDDEIQVDKDAVVSQPDEEDVPVFDNDIQNNEDNEINDEDSSQPVEIGITVTAPDNWNPNSNKKPSGLHMSYQHEPDTSITFQWQTTVKDSSAYKPKIWLVPAEAVKDGDPSQFEQDVTMPYVKELVFEGKGEPFCSSLLPCGTGKEDKMLWVAEASGLKPDTVYYYRVGTFDSFDETTGEFVSADFSPAYHFRTALPKGSEDSFKVGFGSDSQSWFDTIGQNVETIRTTYGKDVRFWLFGGDLVEMGTQSEENDWMNVMKGMVYYYPFMPVQGNHDMIVSRVLFGNWALPRMDSSLLSSDLKEHAWSFNYGNTHFVGLDSSSDTTAKNQAAWLDADLSAARADSSIKWIVVVFHHPAYSSSTAHGSTDYVQSRWVPIFDKYHVDLCFSGHDHDYERTKTLKGNQVVADGKGTVYIVSGGFYSEKSYGNGTSDFTEISVDGPSKSHVILSFEGNSIKGEVYNGNHEHLDSFIIAK